MHGTELINDLGIVLLCAAVVTLFFKQLRIPVFLGYLLAGFLIGPGFWPDTPVHDRHSIESLSEFGVIFLMFYLGMEFDLRRLKRVLGPALVAIVLQTIALLLLGVQLAPLLGWTPLQGIFLGGLMSISSSMVSVAVLQDLGRWDRPHAQLAVGVLLLEDILAIILLVVLSGLALSQGEGEAAMNMGQVLQLTFVIGAFVVGVFFVGRLVAPKLLKSLDKIGSIELITVWVVAVMLGMGILAEKFHFSAALGSFVAGSVMSQSMLSERIEHATEPLRNIFCAVFFVSIGMLIDPGDLTANVGVILLLSVLVVLVKVTTVWTGLVLGGQNPRTSFRAASVKGQIGEFSFVIVKMGMAAGVTNSSWMAVAVGVAVVSSVLSLLLTIKVDSVYGVLSRRIPSGLHTVVRFYQNMLEDFHIQIDRNRVWLLVKRPITQVTFNFFLIAGIFVAASFGVGYIKDRFNADSWLGLYILSAWVGSALVCLPFAIAMIRNVNAMTLILSEAIAANKGQSAVYQRTRMHNIAQTVATVLVMGLLSVAYVSAMATYMPSGASLVLSIVVALLIGAFFWNRLIRINNRLELLFMESFNLQAPTAVQSKRASMAQTVAEHYPWPVEIQDIAVAKGATACGRSLRDLALREKTGANVVGIERDGYVAYQPAAGTLFFPGDHVFLFGTPEQIAQAEAIFKDIGTQPGFAPRTTFNIERIYIDSHSEIADQTLASSDLRRSRGITVLGVQRGADRITNPEPNEMILPGDVLYVIGREDTIHKLQGSNGTPG